MIDNLDDPRNILNESFRSISLVRIHLAIVTPPGVTEANAKRLLYKLIVKRSSTDATPGVDEAAFSTLRRSSQYHPPFQNDLITVLTVMRIASASTSA